MRDLEKYPITTDEIIQCLQRLMDDVSYEKTGLVGDMRPLLLANAIQIIMEADADTWIDSLPDR